jgi:hypothetical protein
MAPPRKTVRQYEAEAERIGACLIRPSGRGAARRVFILRHGEIPSNIAVCHTCDNPRCIEDAHHFKGTWGDNVRDAVRKGRHSCFQNGVKKGEERKGFGKLRDPKYGKKISEGLKRAYAEGRRKRPTAFGAGVK